MDRYRGSSRRSPPPRNRPYRERDDHPNVEYFGEGESYRPGGAKGEGPYRPPNRDRVASDSWSSERRDGRRDERREDIDSYIPNTSSRAQRPKSRSPAGYRRRSPSPANRDRGDLFSNRARSPPRRFSPRRDDRPRSPPRRRSRSPYGGRGRSPSETKRSRDYSPDPRRSPKRERLSSPDRNRYERPRSPARRTYSPPRDSERGNYRPRSRTPPRRDDRQNAYGDESWRRGSSRQRASGTASENTSRRSSPRAQPDRTSLAGSIPRSPTYQNRSQHDSRGASASHRERSPRRDLSPPPDHDERNNDVNSYQEDYRQNRDTAPPPSGPSSQRNGSYEKPPPTGPSRSYNQSGQATPSGPSATSVSMSAHNRNAAPSMLSAPTRPRGAPAGRFDGPPRDFTSPPMRSRGNPTYRGSTPRAASYHQSENYPPAGPRGSTSSRGDYTGGRGDGGSYRGGYGRSNSISNNNTSININKSNDYNEGGFPYRPNNSSSTTYPRTQRFNTTTTTSSTTNYLNTTEKLVPGGKLLPSGLPPDQEKRIKSLEAEAEKMRSEIAEKQKSKREVVNEWENRERETEREALRSDLAEGHLQKLTEGEDGIGSGGVAF